MNQQVNPLPKWILIVSAIFALMEIGVSVSLVASPQAVLETVDVNAQGVIYVVYMWAVRQFALGVIFGFATLKRSRSMLTIAYVFFLVMFLGDCVIGIIQKENGMIIASVIMSLVSMVMLIAISRKKQVS